MTPRTTMNDRNDGGGRDAKLLREHGAGDLMPAIPTTYFNHLINGEPGIRSAIATLTTLGDPVNNVVEVCSQKQVTRIHAWRIVTNVKNMQPVWDRAIREFPRNSVCGFHLPIASELSVALRVGSRAPFPARFGSSRRIDLRPETILDRRIGLSATIDHAFATRDRATCLTAKTTTSGPAIVRYLDSELIPAYLARATNAGCSVSALLRAEVALVDMRRSAPHQLSTRITRYRHLFAAAFVRAKASTTSTVAVHAKRFAASFTDSIRGRLGACHGVTPNQSFRGAVPTAGDTARRLCVASILPQSPGISAFPTVTEVA